MIIRKMSFPHTVSYKSLKDCNFLQVGDADIILVRDLYNGTYQPVEVLSLKPLNLDKKETDREYYLMDYIAHTFYGKVTGTCFLRKTNGVLKHVSIDPEKLGDILKKGHFESLVSLDEDTIASLLPEETIESEYHYNEDEQILRLLEASKILVPKIYALASDDVAMKEGNWQDNVIFLVHNDTIEDLKGEKRIEKFTRVALPDDFTLETQVHIELLKCFLEATYKKEANKCKEAPTTLFTKNTSFVLYDKSGVAHSWNITFMSTPKTASLFEGLKTSGIVDVTIFNDGIVNPEALLGATIGGVTTFMIGNKTIEPTAEDKRISFN